MRTRKSAPDLRIAAAGVLLACFACSVPGFADEPADTSPAAELSKPATRIDPHGPSAGGRELFTGRVVLLEEALKRRGLHVAAEMAGQAVLETEHGELVPLLADWRGRAFFQDERLRNREVELVGSRRPGMPYLNVLMVYTFDKDGTRQYTDYWCDICSIPMYEIQPCDCCQGDIRLRFQPQNLPEELHRAETGAKPSVPAVESSR
ncbi:MAG: hypothetical protein AB7Q45_26615 [Planctomycetaceae bacterium]